MSDQFIHSKVLHLQSGKHFYLTFIYGHNLAEVRKPLWNGLIDLSGQMHDACCVLEDFNSVLYLGDKIGGTEVQDIEVKPLAECIASCELHEVNCRGPYFTWTNKTIWTRIDRAFINAL